MNALEYWLGELGTKSISTKEKYLLYFNRFYEWLNETPNEILEQRKQDLKSEEMRIQRRYESKLISYLSFLDDKGYSTSTQQVAFAAVSSFFEMNYFPLRMRRGDYPRGENIGYRAATQSDILRLLDTAGNDVRLKTMILFLKDSGLRVSDLISITYGDIRIQFETGEDFIPLHLITKKNGTLAKTAIGPETIGMLKVYFEQRRKGTRKIPGEKIMDDSPLFRARKKVVQAPARSSVSSAVNYLVNRAGLKGEISAHSLRKFTETRLEMAGVNPNWVDQIIGHRLPGVRGSYSRPENEDLFQAYKDAYNYLRVFEVPASASDLERTATELRKAQSEIQELKTDLALTYGRNNSMGNDVQKLQSEMVELREILKAVIENPELIDEVKKKII